MNRLELVVRCVLWLSRRNRWSTTTVSTLVAVPAAAAECMLTLMYVWVGVQK